jgi:hypothetical protein
MFSTRHKLFKTRLAVVKKTARISSSSYKWELLSFTFLEVINFVVFVFMLVIACREDIFKLGIS